MGKTVGRAVLLFVLFIGAAACGNTTTPFAPGIIPIDPVNMAPLPDPEGDNLYPEKFNQVVGNMNGYDWGHMSGYFQASSVAVWAAIKDPEVVADRRSASDLKYQLDIEPSYHFSYQLHYYVDDVITVEWKENWRYELQEGSDLEPLVIVNSNQKVWGTEFIRIDAGSMRIEKVSDDVTRFEFMEHLNAEGSDTKSITQYYKDLFASIAARVHGNPLPKY